MQHNICGVQDTVPKCSTHKEPGSRASFQEKTTDAHPEVPRMLELPGHNFRTLKQLLQLVHEVERQTDE